MHMPNEGDRFGDGDRREDVRLHPVRLNEIGFEAADRASEASRVARDRGRRDEASAQQERGSSFAFQPRVAKLRERSRSGFDDAARAQRVDRGFDRSVISQNDGDVPIGASGSDRRDDVKQAHLGAADTPLGLNEDEIHKLKIRFVNDKVVSRINAALIPNRSIIPGDSIAPQEFLIFFLKCYMNMMYILVFDRFRDLIEFIGVDREGAAAVSPIKIGVDCFLGAF